MKYKGKYSLKIQLNESFTGSGRAQYGDDVASKIADDKGYKKGAEIGQSTPDLYDQEGNAVEAKGMKSGTMSIEISQGDYPALRQSISARAKEIAIEQGSPEAPNYSSAIERAVRELVSKPKALEIAKKYFADNGGTIETSHGPITIDDVVVADSIGGSYGGDKNRSKITVKYNK